MEYIFEAYSGDNRLCTTTSLSEIQEVVKATCGVTRLTVQTPLTTYTFESDEDFQRFVEERAIASLRARVTKKAPYEDIATIPENASRECVSDKFSLQKAQFRCVPESAFYVLAEAMKNGADKYGILNFRHTDTTVSIFIDKAIRHLMEFKMGVDYAEDSKVHHLGHAMADIAVLFDAVVFGNIIDDRVKGPSLADIQAKVKCG